MFVEADPGTYELTEDTVGTRFAMVLIRTFAAATDPEDIRIAHAAQDAIIVEGGGNGPFETPNWDLDDTKVIREALGQVATRGVNSALGLGTPEQTQPVDHLINVAAGWGGQPKSAAMYELGVFRRVMARPRIH